MAQDATALIWIDMEMSGLDPDRDRVLEVAVVITDAQLNTVAEAPVLVVHQDDSVLDNMDAWNTSTHARTGLTQRVRTSALSESEAEKRMLEFVSQYLPQGASPMCGNSVHQDRRFLARSMPQLEAYFLYRNLDVSTLKELARRWVTHESRPLGRACRGARADETPRHSQAVPILIPPQQGSRRALSGRPPASRPPARFARRAGPAWRLEGRHGSSLREADSTASVPRCSWLPAAPSRSDGGRAPEPRPGGIAPTPDLDSRRRRRSDPREPGDRAPQWNGVVRRAWCTQASGTAHLVVDVNVWFE